MKALLMDRDGDFDSQRTLPWNEPALTKDLELNSLFSAMASGDPFLYDIARIAVLCGVYNNRGTILYRQGILKDCLANPGLVRRLYSLAVDAVEDARTSWWDTSGQYPGSALFGAISLLDSLREKLRDLRLLAEEAGEHFRSEGFTALFALLQLEIGDDYLNMIDHFLTELKFQNGTLISAEIGENAEGTNYTLVRPPEREPGWFKRLLTTPPPGYTFRLDSQDETGGRIISGMRERGISRVAIALAQAAGHVQGFFKTLRTELAFYVGCMNLHDRLAICGEPGCFPEPFPENELKRRFRELYDVCLSLQMGHRVVGNDVDANDKHLTIITGANQGGKSSFLRSIGLAQLMMQCGMFVCAKTFEAELCPAIYTHYKREEDATLKSGRLDEELARLSSIADHIRPNSLLLLNESFAATNEREGSEIATQIIAAMAEKRVKVFFVTHLYEFARKLFDRRLQGALFLRAERLADGTRTFKLAPGEPLETSYGEDLYREMFGHAGSSEPI